MIPVSQLRTGQYLELQDDRGNLSTRMVAMISRPGEHRLHVVNQVEGLLADETAVAVFGNGGLDWYRYPAEALVKARSSFDWETVLP